MKKRGRPVENRKCDVDGCDRKHFGRGLCAMHYGRLYRGKPLEGSEHGNSKLVVGYRMAHIRIEKARGKARIYFCVDCTNQAEEWSLSDRAELVMYSKAPNSAGKAYSLDVGDYDPLCISCHHKRDGIKPVKS